MSSIYSSDDIYHPSYFELLASTRLITGLKPALKHLFNVIAQRNSTTSGIQASEYWAVKYYDELFYTLLYILESYYLNKYNGTFEQNFYGLKTVHINDKNNINIAAINNTDNTTQTSNDNNTKRYTNLTESQQSKTLLITVLLPYIHSKCDILYHTLTSEYNDLGEQNMNYTRLNNIQEHNTFSDKLKRIFVKIYPYIHTIIEFINFLFNIQYLFDRTEYYNITHYILKQTIRRLSMQDMLAFDIKNKQQNNDTYYRLFRQVWDQQPNNRISIFRLLHTLLVTTLRYIADSAQWLFILCIFVFKFIEWWYSPQNRNNVQVRLPIPQPPKQSKQHKDSTILLPNHKTLCPLCNHNRVNTACLHTGYTFCYTCIHSYLQTHDVCPITLLPANVDQIRRIYEEQ